MKLIDRLFGSKIKQIDKSKLPVHIAIIPDGNGRWAKRRGLPRTMGHKAGSENIKKIVKLCNNIGIKYLTVYAFSTENWSRPKSEVDALMSLLLEYLRNAEKELSGANIRINVIGNIAGLPSELQKEIPRVEELTRKNTGLNLVMALNYGGRKEILCAVKSIVKSVANGDIKMEDIDEEVVSEHLYTKDIPDPDLIIRTSGEKRSSNFLLWQSAYSEFWFSEVLWPDFNEKHLLQALEDYQSRKRRFGGI